MAPSEEARGTGQTLRSRRLRSLSWNMSIAELTADLTSKRGLLTEGSFRFADQCRKTPSVLITRHQCLKSLSAAGNAGAAPEQGLGEVPERGSGEVAEQGSGEVPEKFRSSYSGARFQSEFSERFRSKILDRFGSGFELPEHPERGSGEVPERGAGRPERFWSEVPSKFLERFLEAPRSELLETLRRGCGARFWRGSGPELGAWRPEARGKRLGPEARGSAQS